MKQILLSALLAFFTASVCLSQISLPGGDFFVNDSFPCPTDSNILIRTKQYWEAYQTSNDLWDGPRDSSCISLRDNSNIGTRILFSEIDTSKIVFVRWVYDTVYPLDTNNLFNLTAQIGWNDYQNLRLDNTCSGGICSGIQLGIQIPDSTGNSNDLRWYTAPVEYDPGFGYQIGICFPTEKFVNGNSVKEVILQFKTRQIQPGADRFTIHSIDFGWMSPVYSEKHYSFTTSFPISTRHWEYDINIFSSSSNNLVMYQDTTYPNANHVSYADVTVSSNPSTIDTIDIIVPSFCTLDFQPYSQLRGSLTQGSTTQRHIVNLINNGGEICMSIVELLFGNGSTYFHKSGELSSEGNFSCMMFWHGGKFILGENQTLHYGKNGKGMLAVRTGGKVEIGKNSELIIGNTFVFGRMMGETTPGHIYLTLNYGSKLTFAPGAKLSNGLGLPEARIFVKMRGGILDDSNLSESERALIVREYDSPQSFLDDNLRILGNPFRDHLTISWISNGNSPIDISLSDIQGRIIYSNNQTTVAGMNFFEIPFDTDETEVMLLTVKTKEGSVTRKVLRIDN